jgi:hypothetical protein
LRSTGRLATVRDVIIGAGVLTVIVLAWLLFRRERPNEHPH